MSPSHSQSPNLPSPPPSGRGATPRRPLAERRDHERRQARSRIATRTTSRLDQQQQTFDPLARKPSSGRRAAIFFLAVAGSVAVHSAIIGGGMSWHLLLSPAPPAREEVKIEVRDRPPEKQPEPPPPPPPPPIEKVIERPKIAKAALPPPEARPPKEPPKEKPIRVVGLSLESAGGEGDGPSFAVGNTRMGETDKKAIAPENVSPPSVEAPPVAAPSGPAASNAISSRIPSAGVKYGKPTRRKVQKPVYPSTLKSQGIEADVTVLVNINVEGKVTSAKVIKPSTYPEFDEAVRTAALADEYEPATRDGVPMTYSLSFTYRFRLEDE